MAESNCPSNEQLMAVATGGTVEASLDPHLRDCPSCQKRLTEMRRDISGLRGANVGLAGDASLDASGEVSINSSKTLGMSSPNSGAAVTGSTGGSDAEDPFEPQGDRFIPKFIGKYKVISHIGSGAQGVVVRALDEEFSRDVVIKMSRRPLPRGESRWAGLADEGRLLAELKHPGLARVFYLGWHTQRRADGNEVEYPYLVMEFVPGRNLAQYAADEHPSPMKSAEIVAKIARALASAHHKGIVHQDIKPANILIEAASNNPRLIDFGLARFESAWSRIRPVGGTVAFMAPEQARLWLSGELSPTSSIFGLSLDGPRDEASDGAGGGARDNSHANAAATQDQMRISPRTDIFALGAVLYYLLLRRPPYSGSVDSMLLAASNGDWDREPLRQIKPAALRAIVARAMAADPGQRYGDADALADDIERCMAHPRVVRRRWLTMGAAAVIAAMAIIGVLLVQHYIQISKLQRATAWVVPGSMFNDLAQDSKLYMPITQLHVTNAGGRPLLLRANLQQIGAAPNSPPVHIDTRFTPPSDDVDFDSMEVVIPATALGILPGSSRTYRCSFEVLDQKTMRPINSQPASEEINVAQPPIVRITSMRLIDEPDPTKKPELTVEVTLHIESAKEYQFEIPLRAYHDGRLPRDQAEARQLMKYNSAGEATTQGTSPVVRALRTPLLLSENDDTRAVEGLGTTKTASADVRIPIKIRYDELYKALGPLKTIMGADIWVAARVNVENQDFVSSEHDPNMWLKIHLPGVPAGERIVQDDRLERQQGDLFQFGGGDDNKYPVSILPPPDPDDLPSHQH